MLVFLSALDRRLGKEHPLTLLHYFLETAWACGSWCSFPFETASQCWSFCFLVIHFFPNERSASDSKEEVNFLSLKILMSLFSLFLNVLSLIISFSSYGSVNKFSCLEGLYSFLINLLSSHGSFCLFVISFCIWISVFYFLVVILFHNVFSIPLVFL